MSDCDDQPYPFSVENYWNAASYEGSIYWKYSPWTTEAKAEFVEWTEKLITKASTVDTRNIIFDDLEKMAIKKSFDIYESIILKIDQQIVDIKNEETNEIFDDDRVALLQERKKKLREMRRRARILDGTRTTFC